MADGNIAAWNDGPGDSIKYRNKIGFMDKVSELDGHWIWIGHRNFAGAPAYRMPSGLWTAATLVGWEIFKGRRVLTLLSLCGVELCVHPDHHYRPRRAVDSKRRSVA